MEKEKQEAINRMFWQYHDLSDQYKAILALSGMDENDIPKMCSLLDMEAMTNVSIVEVRDKQSWRTAIMYGRNGMEYLKADRSERLRMGRKAAYLNELDSDEVRRAVAGFYVATCMAVLSVYLAK